ncbi:putative RNA-directed DNA polymerase [Helianthus annuus]|nr:putative RNA-directed DNA polymerase [Helianthus annuus]
MEPKLHPALTVSNIKNLIPVTLEAESAQYSTWSELFRIQCRVFQVLDHLSPKPTTDSDAAKPATPKPTTDSDKSTTTPPTDASWDRLDAVVLQWIYSTVSTDLLNTVITPGMTAHDAWKTLAGLFNDNKAARALHLTHKLTTTRLENFPNMSAYCQAVKTIADQLANVDCPLDNHRLVLQLLAGLTDAYEGISTILQSKEPLPTFYEARSQLCMIEDQKAERSLQASQSATQALAASTTRPGNNTDTSSSSDRSRGRGRTRNRGRGRFSHNSSGRRPQQSVGWPMQPPFPWSTQQPWQPQAPQYSPWPSWQAPPCPYPSTPQPNIKQGQGILGPRPSQAHYTTYSPTDIQQALHTMTLHPPDYSDGVMDSGATISMDPNSGLQEPDAYYPVRQQR